MTRDLYNVNFVSKLTLLLQFNLATAAIAMTILLLISSKQSPHRVAPRYLRPVTSSYFCSFMLLSSLMSFVLLVMILFSLMRTPIA